MARRDLSNKDFSEHATGELDYVLKKQVDEKKSVVPTVTAAEAMQEDRVLRVKSERNVTRVLFISQNTDLLNPTRQTLDGYLNISEVFDEVHILILRQGIQPKQPVFRPEKNVFMYTVATRFWWQMPIAGVEMIESQLVFAEGFRPDLVVARDPFESALIAWWIARKYKRPMQLHVLVNYFHPSFLELAKPNRWRKFVTHFTVPRFYSVRAATDRILERLRAKIEVSDLERLPQLNPYDMMNRLEQTLNLREKYPEYVFTILFVGTLKNSIAASQAIDAARYMLRNPKVSMIIMGDGPGRSECEKKVRVLGIEKQVIFEYRSLAYAQYIKAADLLVVTNVDDASEEMVLKAAGSGTPMVMIRTDRRNDTFTHMESAYMCKSDDLQAHSDGVHELMNNYELRKQVSEQAFKVVSEKFHQDPDVYRHQYRSSIEAAMFAEDEAKESESMTEDTETKDVEVED